MAKQYTLLVWNTVISQYEETAVSKEVYDEYRRSEWRISKNNDKHSAHETPFSALIGGDDGKVENFHEFLSDEEGPEKLIDKKGLMNTLRKAILSLNRSDQELVEALFFKGMSEREYAEQTGVLRNAIHKRKQRILRHLKNIWKIDPAGCAKPDFHSYTGEKIISLFSLPLRMTEGADQHLDNFIPAHLLRSFCCRAIPGKLFEQRLRRCGASEPKAMTGRRDHDTSVQS